MVTRAAVPAADSDPPCARVASRDGLDVLDLISAEQCDARELVRRLRLAQRGIDPALADELVDELARTLLLHIEVAEEVFYPALAPRGVVTAAVERHRALAAAVREWRAHGASAAAAFELERVLAEHSAATEQEVLPVARKELAGGLARLTCTYRAVRRNAREDLVMPQLLAFVLGPDACCLDVGCHRGVVLEHMLRYAPHGHHIAYEPLPSLAADLRRRFPAVEVREAAAADACGEATFVHVRAAPAYSGLRAVGASVRGWPPYITDADLDRIVVRCEAIDASLPAGWVPSFVKIDVEGAEAMVIRGAMETIATHRPVVAFEHLGLLPAYGIESAVVWDMLVREAGLRVYDTDGRGPYTRDGFAAAAETLTRSNFVARP